MHLVGIRIADAGRIALHAEKIIDGISQILCTPIPENKEKAGGRPGTGSRFSAWKISGC